MDQDQFRNDYLRMINRLARFDFGALFDGISRSDFFILQTIYHYQRDCTEGGMKVSDLAAALGVAPPGVSRSLRLLESKGLVERRVNHADLRHTLIGLTAAGTALRQQIVVTLNDFIDGINDKMGPDKMGQLFGLWQELADIMETEMARVIEGGRDVKNH